MRKGGWQVLQKLTATPRNVMIENLLIKDMCWTAPGDSQHHLSYSFLAGPEVWKVHVRESLTFRLDPGETSKAKTGDAHILQLKLWPSVWASAHDTYLWLVSSRCPPESYPLSLQRLRPLVVAPCDHGTS